MTQDSSDFAGKMQRGPLGKLSKAVSKPKPAGGQKDWFDQSSEDVKSGISNMAKKVKKLFS